MRIDYGNDLFLPSTYDPAAIFVRSINDQQSILGAYSYLLGLYPDTLNGLTLEPDVEPVGTAPVSNYEVNTVRGNVRLGSPSQATKQAKIYPGNPDALFLTKLSELYPGIAKQLTQQLFDAKVEYEETHGTKFYEEFAKAIHKPIDNVNFDSIYRYADDILTTKANGEPSAVSLTKADVDNLSVYYGHRFGNGLFRDSALTRVFAHTYLASVAHELQMKMEDDQSGKWANQGIHELRHSVYLSNHLTMLAALHLFNEAEDYRLDFNDELRFQLFKKDGKYFVRSLLNDKPLSLEGTSNADGEAEWSTWRDYICTKLYYGQISKVKEGAENPSEFLKLKDSCANFMSNAFLINDKIQKKDHDLPPAKPESPTPVPKEETKPRAPASDPIAVSNMDEGVLSQPVEISAGKTNKVVQYAWNKPLKLERTQSKEFDIPMIHWLSTDMKTESTEDVPMNQYRKIKIKTTENTAIELPERKAFNFAHDLLKTREVSFTNVDLIKIPQMTENKGLFLADRHQFDWGQNPSLSSGALKFNHHTKIKIPQTVTEEFALPEKHVFNYNSNSLNVKKVNFDHIKSVKVKQAESYDVNLSDFKFENLNDNKKNSVPGSEPIDTQFENQPVKKLDDKPATSPSSSVPSYQTGKPDYVAPIRIKQEYNPSGVGTTADKEKSTQPALRPAPEPAPIVPQANPSTTPQGSPDYEPPKSYPSYHPVGGSSTSSSSTKKYPSYTPKRSSGTTSVSGSPYTRA